MNANNTFVPGLELSRWFYEEAVKPLLDRERPGLLYSAALLGRGSEVLGFDTEMSTDHDWGPRLLLFLQEEDYPPIQETLHQALQNQLPDEFRGYPTRFEKPSDIGQRVHHVEITTVRRFILDCLDFDIQDAIEPADWLTFPEQKLRTLTAGAVYHDAVGLQAVRERFAYYPRDVWLYLLAAGWNRIGQEEHLMGRAGFVGDELGSALIASRLVRDLMRLCFLMERQYAPYPKWFGTAFQQLTCAPELTPLFRAVQTADSWQIRDRHLAAAYEIVATMHNAMGIMEPLPAQVSAFFDRPFQVIHLRGGFSDTLCAQIRDPIVKQIASQRLIGSIDQFSDSTDILSDAGWRRRLRFLYE